MNWRRLAVVVIFPSLAVAVAYLDYNGRLYSVIPLGSFSPPSIEIPARVTLPTAECGKEATGRFTLSNTGGRELFIHDIRSSCGCIGFEVESNGTLARLESLKIRAGEKADVLIRTSVIGSPGSAIRHVVAFQTNDPGCRTARIEFVVAKITGGINTRPGHVVFGTLLVGKSYCQIVNIHDQAISPRRVKRVASSNPELFQVCLLPKNNSQADKTSATDLIGQVEIVPRTKHPATLTGNVEIYLEGEDRPPDLVPVTGRVAPLVEAAPSVLMLPRRQGKELVFFAHSICRCLSGDPFTLEICEASPDLLVTIESASEPNSYAIRIEWRPSATGRKTAPSRAEVRLRARIDQEESTFAIPVVRTSPDDK
jgi:hypothetical protein